MVVRNITYLLFHDLTEKRALNLCIVGDSIYLSSCNILIYISSRLLSPNSAIKAVRKSDFLLRTYIVFVVSSSVKGEG